MGFEDKIKDIEKKIGYTFRDKSLLKQAFTRTSYCNEHKSHRGRSPQSNEVLEFLGDSALSAAIVTLLMQDLSERYEYGIYTTLREGDFSNIKSKLSDKKNLSLATKKLGLEKYLLMGEGDAKLGIENEPSVMEDLFESIVGAIYIDSENNLGKVISALSHMLDTSDYLGERTPPIQSHKNLLQEWCADKKHRRDAPVYKTVSESGPDHKKIYERACYIGDKIYGVGIGKNQKLADADAAEKALMALKEEYENEQSKKNAEEHRSSLTCLKEYAVREKLPSPEFRDLGETKNSTSKRREYEIECRFASMSARGCAESKQEAKAIAAERLYKMLPSKKTASHTNRVIKNAKKRSNSQIKKRT